jgi:benzoyl-CoA reductase/2-hydroxyglutaryl-CoA dehydratase subunit BcrC/BadD/HgdB
MAIGLRYLSKPHSALKDNVWRRRPDQIFRLYEDYQADGVIIAKQIYCHPHGTDMYAIWKMLRERNIPYHSFERDTTLPYEETRPGVEGLISLIKPGMTRLRGWSVS